MAHDSLIARLVPQYVGTGGNATAADLSEIAQYAGNYGNYASETDATRLGRSGSALWLGLMVYATDTDILWRYGPAGWIIAQVSPAAVTVATFGTNWTAGTSPQVPTCYRQGNRVDLVGSVAIGASGGGGGYTNILTVPAAVQPPTTGARPVGNSVTSTGGFVTELQIAAGVLASVPGYVTGSLGFSTRLLLHCSWYLD